MFSWREVMTKRVAWFTGEPSVKDCFTPHKVYDVLNEDENLFNLKDDTGGTRICRKKGCAHICRKDWVFADVVEQTVKQETVEEDIVTTKQPKWSEWIKNTTGKCPDGLKRKQKIKLKWSDGDKFNIGKPHDAAWYIDKGGVNITHYKVKLKDVSEDTPKAQEKPKSKWTKNTGVNPLNTDACVKIVRRDSGKVVMKARYCDWSLSGHSYDIIKWRLAD